MKIRGLEYEVFCKLQGESAVDLLDRSFKADIQEERNDGSFTRALCTILRAHTFIPIHRIALRAGISIGSFYRYSRGLQGNISLRSASRLLGIAGYKFKIVPIRQDDELTDLEE